MSAKKNFRKTIKSCRIKFEKRWLEEKEQHKIVEIIEERQLDEKTTKKVST